MIGTSSSARAAFGVRAVLLVLALVISVVIHHGVEHGAMPHTAGASMPGMTADASMSGMTAGVSMPSAAVGAADDDHGQAVADTGASLGCGGDLMCDAAGVAKAPHLAQPGLAVLAGFTLTSAAALVPRRHVAAPAPPPGGSAVLRI